MCIKRKGILIFLAVLMLFGVFATNFYSPITAVAVFDENYYELKAETTLLSEYTTYYKNSTSERKHNIKLATNSINETKIHANRQFSFNSVVGARNVANGYQISKIIVNYEFKEGVGGGVCQVSTTLYNAVLLAGLKVDKAKSHSLPISYVPLSFDAMVSSGQDFAFTNNTPYLVIIEGTADNEKVTFKIFSEQPKQKQKIVLRSEKIEEINLGYELIEDVNNVLLDGETEKIIQNSKIGYKSAGYIDIYENGKVIKSKKIRTDTYMARQGKKLVRPQGWVPPEQERIEDKIEEIKDGENKDFDEMIENRLQTQNFKPQFRFRLRSS